MISCFISYASVDKVIAESLANQLRLHDYKVWIDLEGIVGGTQWETEIKKGIAHADAMLIVLTPDAIKSEWVKREIEIARNSLKIVIPLLMREISIPNDLVHLGISDLQYINFVRYGLATSLESLLGILSQSSDVSPVSAREKHMALIIEDISAQQMAIRQVLQKFDLSITIAHDFETALENIRSGAFDLVTLDMQLDAMDTGGQHGILLLDELRTYQKDVPIIIISALNWTGRQVRDFLREYQAFDYLPKPFKSDELHSLVELALKKSK